MNVLPKGRVFALLGLLTMLAIILYGFSRGDFFEEGKIITSMAWGRVTLVDLYVGLAFFALWIIHRESSILRAAAWIILLVFLGNLAASAYLYLAFLQSRHNGDVLWHGKKSVSHG